MDSSNPPMQLLSRISQRFFSLLNSSGLQLALALFPFPLAPDPSSVLTSSADWPLPSGCPLPFSSSSSPVSFCLLASGSAAGFRCAFPSSLSLLSSFSPADLGLAADPSSGDGSRRRGLAVVDARSRGWWWDWGCVRSPAGD